MPESTQIPQLETEQEEGGKGRLLDAEGLQAVLRGLPQEQRPSGAGRGGVYVESGPVTSWGFKGPAPSLPHWGRELRGIRSSPPTCFAGHALGPPPLPGVRLLEGEPRDLS